MSQKYVSTYEWKSNFINKGVSAQAVGNRLEELSEKFGGVTSQILLDDSRSELAVCHPLYEWNDAKAAEKYRLKQSGDIIRSIIVVESYLEKGTTQEPVVISVKKEEAPRAFSSVIVDDGSRKYKETVKVLENDKTYAQLEAECRAYIKGAKDRYNKYAFFKDILEELLGEVEA